MSKNRYLKNIDVSSFIQSIFQHFKICSDNVSRIVDNDILSLYMSILQINDLSVQSFLVASPTASNRTSHIYFKFCWTTLNTITSAISVGFGFRLIISSACISFFGLSSIIFCSYVSSSSGCVIIWPFSGFSSTCASSRRVLFSST